MTNLDEKLSALRDLVQFDIGQRGLARDPVRNLVNAHPNDFAAACRSIAQHPAPHVAIVTGFWIADARCGETDGPLGTVFLANVLQSLSIPTRIIVDDWGVQAIRIGLEESGTAGAIDIATEVGGPVTHLVAIERVGPAADGRCYSMRGRDITDFMAPLHRPFEAADRPVTIGIGDGGNEIGMGKIDVDTIDHNIPNGRKIACRTATDFLIVAGISNWGSYALAAGIALARGREPNPTLFTPEHERRVLAAMVEHGPLVDGKTGDRAATVDGVTFPEYIAVLNTIHEILAHRL